MISNDVSAKSQHEERLRLLKTRVKTKMKNKRKSGETPSHLLIKFQAFLTYLYIISFPTYIYIYIEHTEPKTKMTKVKVRGNPCHLHLSSTATLSISEGFLYYIIFDIYGGDGGTNSPCTDRHRNSLASNCCVSNK